MSSPVRLSAIAALLATFIALAALPAARSAEPVGGLFPLLPANVSGTSLVRPGELRENRLFGERQLPLTPQLQWLTSTDLRGVRHEQGYPLQSQSLSLSTGPRLRLGQAELAIPVLSSHEANAVGEGDVWRTTSPRLTVALGPNDRIRLEARISRNDAGARRSRQSTSVAWKHRINERWALSTGLSHSRSLGAAESHATAEVYAGIDATRPGGLSWSLTSRISGTTYGQLQGPEPAMRGQTTSLLLSTRYPLSGGWWLGSELKTAQTTQSDGLQAVSTQSAGLRLFKNF